MSDFVLMRHGHALPAGEDSERGLSERGRLESREVAAKLAAAGATVDRIVHSGKKRARETAEILGERVGRGGSPEAIRGLDPHDDVGAIAAELESSAVGTAVVGHLPNLNYLLARLLRGAAAPGLGTSCAVHLRRSGTSWTLVAHHRPGE